MLKVVNFLAFDTMLFNKSSFIFSMKHERDPAGPEVYLLASEQAFVGMGARASIEISHFVLDIKNYQL